MYVTLEPCDMCMGAIKEVRIKNVYYDAKKTTEISNKVNLIFAENDKCSSLIVNFFKNVRK